MTEPKYDLITFGETMIRLTTTGDQRLETTPALQVTVGGSESNVCVGLARLGRQVAWMSALPSNALGARIAGELRGHGVSVDHVLWSDTGRVGVYFMETGARPRPTRVTYDRAGSVVAEVDPDDVNYTLVTESRALHLTGITPALSPSCARVCQRLVETAVGEGVTVILDVNYRSLLWSPEEARRGLAGILEHVNVLLCGQADASTVWGMDGGPVAIATALLDFSSAEIVVVTLGDAGVFAKQHDGQIWEQPAMPVDIVDPVGAGDAFAAGFLHRWLDDSTDIDSALRSGVAMAALGMTIPGDLAIVGPDDLAAALLLIDGGTGDIVR